MHIPPWIGPVLPNVVQLRDPIIKADQATIVGSLQGHWRAEPIFELTGSWYCSGRITKISECDREIEDRLERPDGRSDGAAPAPNGKKRN